MKEAKDNIYLWDAFEAACKALPHLPDTASPLGTGAYGLVIDHGDEQSLTKIIYKPRNEQRYKTATAMLQNETHALRLFERHPLAGIKTPVILHDPETIQNDRFIAFYQMTKISGHADTVLFSDSGTDHHFSQLGRVLADFHEAARALPQDHIKPNINLFTANIAHPNTLWPALSEALAAANDYLLTHRRGEVIHGDFHGGNIIVDDDNQISGLIDLAAMGYSQNDHSDFMCVPDRFLPSFIQGYEQAGGKTVDPFLIMATKVGMWADRLSHENTANQAVRSFLNKKINYYLDKLAPVTGIKP